MAYELHLVKRGGRSVSEREWIAAVEAVPDVRRAAGKPQVVENPTTGQKISMSRPTLDAEILFPDGPEWGPIAGQWVPVFRWSPRRGRISVNARFDPDDAQDPVRRAMAQLAKQLDAEIVGDDGEKYNF